MGGFSGEIGPWQSFSCLGPALEGVMLDLRAQGHTSYLRARRKEFPGRRSHQISMPKVPSPHRALEQKLLVRGVFHWEK